MKNSVRFLAVLVLSMTSLTVGMCQTGDLLTIRDASGERPVKNRKDWQLRREKILLGMQEAMGKLPDRSDLPPVTMQIKDTLKLARYSRFTIHISAAENEIVPAYLYLPSGTKRNEKRAAMLVLHGTGDPGKQLVDGKSDLTNRAHAKELAERGYVVIAPDYPSMGDLKDYDFDRD